VAHGQVALSARGSLSLRALSVLLFLGGQQLLCVVLAQATQATAEAALAVANRALQAALVSPEAHHPDQPLWRAALGAADWAVVVSKEAGSPPTVRAALRLSARVHGLTGWYSRSFAAWDEFLVEGGELSSAPEPSPDGDLPSDVGLFSAAGTQLGFARYQLGDLQDATAYYLTVLELVPDEPEALRWLGRIAFESDRADIAERYFARLVELRPDDEAASFYLQLSRERQEIGTEASDAFRRGINSYEAGDLTAALDEFERAFEANQGFIEAALWSGRVSLELDRPEVAVPYWQLVVQERPGDAGAAWFLEYALAQRQWGVQAGRSFYEGQAAYQSGDLVLASERFQSAVAANDAFLEAWVWAARSLQERGEPAEALRYWQGVLERDPADERAGWFVIRAEYAVAHGNVAGPAYIDALAHFQAGDRLEARRLLETAVRANERFADAWGYLGRIAFLEQRYADAFEAYRRAAELAPDNEDYAFFREEARRMSVELQTP